MPQYGFECDVCKEPFTKFFHMNEDKHAEHCGVSAHRTYDGVLKCTVDRSLVSQVLAPPGQDAIYFPNKRALNEHMRSQESEHNPNGKEPAC